MPAEADPARNGRRPGPSGRPARFGDALRVAEFRWLLTADVLSLVGDQVTKVAIATLVFSRTDSAVLAAATFAVSYLPWLVGGTVLSAVADRLPRRRVMVACDLGRAVAVLLLALPAVPLPAVYALLFTASLMTPPFASARAATVPDILPGDAYVAGNALVHTTFGVGQVVGLLAGGLAVALLSVPGALALDAATFLTSAFIVGTRLRPRPAVAREGPPVSLLTDTRDGLRLVLGDRVLRSLLLLAWCGAAFNVVPEGLAVVEAHREGGGPLLFAVLVATLPAGIAVGSLGFARFVAPAVRLRLMLPVCLAGFVPLLLCPLSPSPAVTGLLWFLAGTSACFQLAANAAFVQSVADSARGRAFGVAQAGLQTSQGLSLLAAGALAEVLAPRTVVALSGAAGLLVVGMIALRWPGAELAARTSGRARRAGPASGGLRSGAAGASRPDGAPRVAAVPEGGSPASWVTRPPPAG